MENKGVVCDVCTCCHHTDGNKCNLAQIKVTEHCNCTQQNMKDPHFCQSYEKK